MRGVDLFGGEGCMYDTMGAELLGLTSSRFFILPMVVDVFEDARPDCIQCSNSLAACWPLVVEYHDQPSLCMFWRNFLQYQWVVHLRSHASVLAEVLSFKLGMLIGLLDIDTIYRKRVTECSSQIVGRYRIKFWGSERSCGPSKDNCD
jgi:hypothetical protein